MSLNDLLSKVAAVLESYPRSVTVSMCITDESDTPVHVVLSNDKGPNAKRNLEELAIIANGSRRGAIKLIRAITNASEDKASQAVDELMRLHAAEFDEDSGLAFTQRRRP